MVRSTVLPIHPTGWSTKERSTIDLLLQGELGVSGVITECGSPKFLSFTVVVVVVGRSPRLLRPAPTENEDPSYLLPHLSGLGTRLHGKSCFFRTVRFDSSGNFYFLHDIKVVISHKYSEASNNIPFYFCYESSKSIHCTLTF